MAYYVSVSSQFGPIQLRRIDVLVGKVGWLRTLGCHRRQYASHHRLSYGPPIPLGHDVGVRDDCSTISLAAIQRNKVAALKLENDAASVPHDAAEVIETNGGGQ